ncbi:unnamed protein product, partial [Rotaria sordida]
MVDFGMASPYMSIMLRSRRQPSNRPRSQVQRRRRGPRQIRLNDFMPIELHEPSTNLPPEFNIATVTASTTTTTTTTMNVPPDALPQRRQRRNNGFVVLIDENDNLSDVEIEEIRRYLKPNCILKWLEEHSRNSKNAISGRGNQAYVWQAYLKMSTEQKHWAKEVVRRTKRRDNIINTRFVQKKINRLTTVIAEACATISETQIQLSTYWMQTISETTNQRLPQTAANIIAKK